MAASNFSTHPRDAAAGATRFMDEAGLQYYQTERAILPHGPVSHPAGAVQETLPVTFALAQTGRTLGTLQVRADASLAEVERPILSLVPANALFNRVQITDQYGISYDRNSDKPFLLVDGSAEFKVVIAPRGGRVPARHRGAAGSGKGRPAHLPQVAALEAGLPLPPSVRISHLEEFICSITSEFEARLESLDRRVAEVEAMARMDGQARVEELECPAGLRMEILRVRHRCLGGAGPSEGSLQLP